MCKKKFYISLLITFFSIGAIAQAPGGVAANLKMWVKSNSGIVTASGLVTTWTYSNDVTKSFAGLGALAPGFSANAINFQPSVTFNGSQLMDGPVGANAPLTALDDDYAVFGVWLATSTSPTRIWTQRRAEPNQNTTGASLSYNLQGGIPKHGTQTELSPFEQTWIAPFTLNTWKATQFNLLVGSLVGSEYTPDLEVLDESSINAKYIAHTYPYGDKNGAFFRNLGDEVNRIGARNNPADEALTGQVVELIVYDAPITTALTSNQIFSYFALKYGIHKTGDYVASNGTTIFWDSTANSTFRYSVFGIGQDDNSGLTVTQSNSVQTGSGTGAGQVGQGNIVLGAPSTLSNNEFLMIGNNNAALTEQATDVPAISDAAVRRLGREWKVQRTGDPGTVTLTFDLSGLTVTGTVGNATDFRLMVDEDGDGNFATGTIGYYQPSGFTGNVATFNNLILGNNQVFTLVTFAANLPLPVTWKSFSARAVSDDIRLTWAVENNDGASHYELEHSTDGRSFTQIANISNNASSKTYGYTHAKVTGGKHYYRIRQVDLDGKAAYSKVVDASVKLADFYVRVLANPIRNNFAELEIKASSAAEATVELWSVTGAMLSQQKRTISSGTNTIKVGMERATAGNYILKVKVKDVVESIQVVKY